MRALLALEDGRVFPGFSFGAQGETYGEVIFNTGMTGYQEILTDPSYKGQLVVMTYPHIGNYGVNPEDIESDRLCVEGLILREYSRYHSNWRSRESLQDLLRRHNIIGIEGVDTRALTRHIRDKGAQRGVISTVDLDPSSLVAKAKASPSLIGRDLVQEVTCRVPYPWNQSPSRSKSFRVIVYDFGVKYNILRKLAQLGCSLWIVPAQTTAEEVLKLNPDGIVLSNGPGDPEGVPYAIENTKKLLGEKPLFGICLGHQILALALGGRTYKLKFGHHGENHPVKNLRTGRVEITSQNHGFAVDPGSLDPDEVELTHVNLYDGTVEGIRHRKLPAFSVQYHPEASPGPHDSEYIFHQFLQMMEEASA